MTSAIDATKPVAGSPTTQSVRDNFATAASEITALQTAPNQTITLSGDISGTGTSAIPTTLPTVNTNVGTWNNVTINAKGLATAGSNVAYVTGGPYLALAGGTLTGPIMLPAGTAAANSVQMVNPGTGMFGIAAGNQLAVATSGVERVRIDNNGNVLVGTTSPLSVAGAPTIQAYRGGVNCGVWAIAGSNFQASLGCYDQTTGHVGTYLFSGNGYAGIGTVDETGAFTGNPINFTGSNVGIGTTAPGSLLTVNGVCANVSGAWTTISDATVKQDVQPYTRGLDAIVALKPVQFRYVAGTPFAEIDKPSRQLFGLIADDVKPHVPEIVGTTTATIGKKEGVTLSTLEPGNLIYALINAVKELNGQREEMVARIAALESATVH